jgi:uncharacterized membrane protein YfcA
MLPHLTGAQWLLAVLAAVGIGLSKSGLSGLSFFHVLVFAFLFGPRDSTGIVLPMLLIGDISAVRTFRAHTEWSHVRRMLPATLIGVVLAALTMSRLTSASFGPLIGWVILGLTALQAFYTWQPQRLGNVPHAPAFAWTIGLLAGAATMFANAAGPIFSLYGLAMSLPKFTFVGTSAWFFLIVNAFKVPFSAWLGLIHGSSLLLNLILAPAVICGLLAGRWITHRLPQRTFNIMLLFFAALAALRLIGAF